MENDIQKDIQPKQTKNQIEQLLEKYSTPLTIVGVTIFAMKNILTLILNPDYGTITKALAGSYILGAVNLGLIIYILMTAYKRESKDGE